ncbi:TetR/AcrR family transcriptional regulator [Paractinoplanes durhamensis]|uniref:TetR/AcrR family transcriptional regulator n=1 Tax=Paractinoplanes durhamensis TaxID=113563 RepID=UPI0023B26F57|nr:TetR/AcrR family transcriptional regulator [Actinoplanes durhamensis]
MAAAMAEIREQGYRSTSLRGIGRALGVQPAQILHYFASREELLETVLRRWDDESEQVLAAAGRPFLDVWPEIVRQNTTVPGFVNLYTSLAAEATDPAHPSHDFFRARFRRVRDLIAGDLAARQVRDPERAALHLVAFSDGLQLQWLVDRSIDLAAELTYEIARLDSTT